MNGVLEHISENRDITADFVEQILFEEIEKAIPALAAEYPSVDCTEILNILRGEASTASLQDTEGQLNQDKVAVFTRLYNLQQTIRGYTPVLMERASEADTDEAFEELEQAIIALKQAGKSYDETCKILSEIKISKSFTSHPTEGLSAEGIALCEKLVEAAEIKGEDNRADSIRAAIKDMVVAPDIGAGKKANMIDEIDASDNRARIHNQGCNRLGRHVKDVMERLYGRRPDEFYLDTGPKSWDYDSDGKNNAEGWAMMAKMSATTMGSIDDALAALKEATRKLSGDENVQQLIVDLEQTKTNLLPVYERSRKIVLALAQKADPLEREAYYRAHYEEFDSLQQQFKVIYNHVDSEQRGFDFFNHTKRTLRAFRDTLYTSAYHGDAEAIDDIYRGLERNGFALEKGQTRQNDIVYEQIIDNLFNDESFRARGILSDAEIAEIDAVAGLQNLDKDRQHELREKVTAYAKDNGNRKKLIEDLYAANPLEFDANGYPSQTRTLLDRFKLRKLYPLKFTEAIISDSAEDGPAHQKFLGDLFGLDKMKHMPLYEDRQNLEHERQVENLKKLWVTTSDPVRQRIEALTEKIEEWQKYYGGRGVHETHMMRPCSDATKGGGSATALEAIDAYRNLVRASLELYDESVKEGKPQAVPLEIMLGCGMSMHRYGGSPDIIRNVVEQELKAHAIWRGKSFDQSDKHDRRLMRSALAMLWTEQGRAKRMFTATPKQLADSFAGYITNMLHGRLDLEGRVASHTYIQTLHVTDLQRTQRARYYKTQIKKYEELRFVEGQDGTRVLDKISAKLTCPNMIKYANNGARPASKNVGSDKRTEKRAIENNQRDYVSQLFLGRYGGGAMLQAMHRDYKNHELRPDELNQILADEEWDYNLFTRDVTDAARADYTYALKKLDWADASFDELITLGGSLRDEDGSLDLSRRGDYTEEQAYLAAAYYDHVIYIAQLEAALDGQFHKNLDDMIEYIRPAEGINVGPGAKTQARFPTAMQIAQEHKRNAAGLELVHMLEDQITDLMDTDVTQATAIEQVGGEAYVRRVASAWRAGTMPHWPLWSGAVSYGAHNQPDPELAPADLVLAHQADMNLGRETPRQDGAEHTLH